MDTPIRIAGIGLACGRLWSAGATAEDAINHGRVAAVTAQGFTEMRGGLPIVVEGDVVGAIGASFDTPEHNVQIAQSGLAAIPR